MEGRDIKELFAVLIVLTCLTQAQVKVITLNNRVFQGKLIGIAKSPTALELQIGNEKKRIDCLDIVEVVCQNRLRDSTKLPCIHLNDGSRVYGDIVGGDDYEISVKSPFLGIVAIDLTNIEMIGFQSGPLRAADAENDILLFKSGDMMEGLISRFGKGYVDVEHPQLGMRRENLDNLSFIIFAESYSEPESASEFGIVVLGTDNSKICGRLLGVDGQRLVLNVPSLGGKFSVDIDQIQCFFFVNGRFVYLSDLPASQYTVNFTPCFGEYRKLDQPDKIFSELFMPKLDHNQRGGAICLGKRTEKLRPFSIEKQTFHKGIGVFAKTEIHIQLNKKYRKFQSHIGIDDSIREQAEQYSLSLGGSVVFRVFVDGEKKFESKTMNWDSDFQTIEVNVAGKKEMVLDVDFADNGNMNDVANWAGARLIK